MLETLTSLKPPKSDPNPSNLKKYLSALGKKRRCKYPHCLFLATSKQHFNRRGLSGGARNNCLTVAVLTTEPLRVSLTDLVESDTRGKWWLVGAGWAGNPLVEKQAKVQSAAPSKTLSRTSRDIGGGEEGLLELAREQGMNTDVRRSVFVILMTSEVSMKISICLL